ncbi:DUF4864 domain-containing protein [Chelatococcus sp. SYSU_G07232]|uniref:DUF4864 domain-containing protein n=1 Tax=Chelatococcus albus TaxID=3047466 RepID=A0ABT7ACK8_9HYPH|nr:DUF4864 domain-containing protein [Chelatococcus sp. SYSU_G07232]MDJ1157108.1 DUF4864 domain-containing protein [Chelatococcus sp. SYSU_G07232]
MRAPILDIAATIPALVAVQTCPTPAQSADREDVRLLIEAQIAAFQRDDAAAAFSLASPGIRERFSDPDTFLMMVRLNYHAVYRPKLVFFANYREVDQGALQSVRIVDEEGDGWLAIFQLERVEGAWAVAGCILIKMPSERA